MHRPYSSMPPSKGWSPFRRGKSTEQCITRYVQSGSPRGAAVQSLDRKERSWSSLGDDQTTAQIAAARRVARQRAKVFLTESEHAFGEPNRPPLDKFSRHHRKMHVSKTDVNLLSENPMMPAANHLPWDRLSLVDLYPEKYRGAAGLTSHANARRVARESISDFLSGRSGLSHYQSTYKWLGAERADSKEKAVLLDGAGLRSEELAHRVQRSNLERQLEELTEAREAKSRDGTTADKVLYSWCGDEPEAPVRDEGDGTKAERSGCVGDELFSRPISARRESAQGARNGRARTVPEAEKRELQRQSTAQRLCGVRQGGECAQLLYGEGARPGAEEYEIHKLAPTAFEGAAGVKSREYLQRQASDQTLLRKLSVPHLYKEAKHLMFNEQADGEQPTSELTADTRPRYPRQLVRAAGSSSNMLYKTRPEFDHRHMYSENLHSHAIRKSAARESPQTESGAAGVESEKLFRGHSLDGLGDERPPGGERHPRCFERAASFLHGVEARKALNLSDNGSSEPAIATIPQHNPHAFANAAGMESTAVERIQSAALREPSHPNLHRLRAARQGGECAQLLYGEGARPGAEEYEIHKLAPTAFEGAFGKSSNQLAASMYLCGEDGGGKIGKRRVAASPDDSDDNGAAFGSRIISAGCSTKDLHQLLRGPVERDNKPSASPQHVGDLYSVDSPDDRKGAAGVSGTMKPSFMLEPRLKRLGSCASLDCVAYEEEDGYRHEIPHLMPEHFLGAAGKSSKDMSIHLRSPWMFGETVGGIALGANRQLRPREYAWMADSEEWADEHKQYASGETMSPPPHRKPLVATHGSPQDDDQLAPARRQASPRGGQESVGSRPPAQTRLKSKSIAHRAEPYAQAHEGVIKLFEKGSYEHRKLDSVRQAQNETGNPLLGGHSSSRGCTTSMGAYAEFAARMGAAQSHRESARSAR